MGRVRDGSLRLLPKVVDESYSGRVGTLSALGTFHGGGVRADTLEFCGICCHYCQLIYSGFNLTKKNMLNAWTLFCDVGTQYQVFKVVEDIWSYIQ